MTTEQQSEPLRMAIGLMTAWLDEPDGGSFTSRVVQEIFDEEGMQGVEKILAGMISLSGILLIRLERSRAGMPGLETLQELAIRHANPN